MTPRRESFTRARRPSPAERGAEFAEIQRRLKQEAAQRRQAEDRVAAPPLPPATPLPRPSARP